LTIAADKLASKEYVANLAPDIYVPRVIWIASEAQSLKGLDVNILPDHYVFKANHCSQTMHIVKHGRHLSRSQMQALAASWLKKDQWRVFGEWAYKNIPRKVFIEEYMDFQGGVPDDYKFFVFHGKVKFIQFDTGRFECHHRNMFDSGWNDLGVAYSHPRLDPPPPKPRFLEPMIDAAERLGANFDFIRVDLYWHQNAVTFGELTVYPGGGYEKFPSWNLDKIFGSEWHVHLS